MYTYLQLIIVGDLNAHYPHIFLTEVGNCILKSRHDPEYENSFN